MNLTIVASRTCHHRRLLERELEALGLGCTVRFIEDAPELASRHGIRGSPNLLADGELVFSAEPGHPVPTPDELKRILDVD